MNFLRTLGKILPPWRVKNYSIADLDETLFKDFEFKTRSGVEIGDKQALSLSAAYACIRVRAETLASLPFKIKRRDGNGYRYTERNHPVHRLLNFAPNERMDALRWKMLMQTHVELRGNAFSFKEMDPRTGEIKRLIPLNPDRIRIDIPKDDPGLAYYFKNIDGSEKKIPSDQMFHLIGGISLDGIQGINPIEFHREAIGLGIAAERHGANYFGNNAFPGGALIYAGEIPDKETRKQRSEELNKNYGKDNSHRWIVLDNGWSIEPLKISNVDSQYLEIRQFEVEEMCRIFNVPGVMIDYSDKTATYAASKEFFMAFGKKTVFPMIRCWETAIVRQLIPEDQWDEYYPSFSMAGLERADIKTRMEAYKIMREMGLKSADDILELEDENPIGGEEGKIRVIPLNMGNLKDLLLTPVERKGQQNSSVEENQDVSDASPSDEQPS